MSLSLKKKVNNTHIPTHEAILYILSNNNIILMSSPWTDFKLEINTVTTIIFKHQLRQWLRWIRRNSSNTTERLSIATRKTKIELTSTNFLKNNLLTLTTLTPSSKLESTCSLKRLCQNCKVASALAPLNPRSSRILKEWPSKRKNLSILTNISKNAKDMWIS